MCCEIWDEPAFNNPHILHAIRCNKNLAPELEATHNVPPILSDLRPEGRHVNCYAKLDLTAASATSQ